MFDAKHKTLQLQPVPSTGHIEPHSTLQSIECPLEWACVPHSTLQLQPAVCIQAACRGPGHVPAGPRAGAASRWSRAVSTRPGPAHGSCASTLLRCAGSVLLLGRRTPSGYSIWYAIFWAGEPPPRRSWSFVAKGIRRESLESIESNGAPESIESNGVADAVKLAVCSCIKIVSQQM
jgi:hypothetical protein